MKYCTAVCFGTRTRKLAYDLEIPVSNVARTEITKALGNVVQPAKNEYCLASREEGRTYEYKTSAPGIRIMYSARSSLVIQSEMSWSESTASPRKRIMF